jgi:hypothetical protein
LALPTEQDVKNARLEINLWQFRHLDKPTSGEDEQEAERQECFRSINTVFGTAVNRTGIMFPYLKEHVRRAIVQHWWWPSSRPNGTTVEDQSQLIYQSISNLRAVPNYQKDPDCARELDLLRAIVADGEGRSHDDVAWFHAWNIEISCQVLVLLLAIERIEPNNRYGLMVAEPHICTEPVRHTSRMYLHTAANQRETMELSVLRRHTEGRTADILHRDEWASITRRGFPLVSRTWCNTVERAATDTNHRAMLIRNIQRFTFNTWWWDPALSLDTLSKTAAAEFSPLVNWIHVVREDYQNFAACQTACSTLQDLVDRFYSTTDAGHESFKDSLIEVSTSVVVLLAAIDFAATRRAHDEAR